MKKITLLLSSLFFFSLGTSACSDEAPSGNTEKPELPVNPEPPVTPSETLKGSFESKFVRYAKGQKFTGQEDDRLVTTVWKDTVWQNERVHKQIVLWTESKRYDDQKLNKIELERNSEYICLTQEQSTRMQGTDIVLDLDQFTEVFPDVLKTKKFLDT